MKKTILTTLANLGGNALVLVGDRLLKAGYENLPPNSSNFDNQSTNDEVNINSKPDTTVSSPFAPQSFLEGQDGESPHLISSEAKTQNMSDLDVINQYNFELLEDTNFSASELSALAVDGYIRLTDFTRIFTEKGSVNRSMTSKIAYSARKDNVKIIQKSNASKTGNVNFYPADYLRKYLERSGAVFKIPNLSTIHPSEEETKVSPDIITTATDTPAHPKVDLPTPVEGLPLIFENDVLGQAVDARDLHKFLGVETQFKDWIKRRIEKYDFVEKLDYTQASETPVVDDAQKRASITMHPTENLKIAKNYIVSLNMAKELCMVENNEKGKQARRYYIACENTLLKNGGVSSTTVVPVNSDKERFDKMIEVFKNFQANHHTVMFEINKQHQLVAQLSEKINCLESIITTNGKENADRVVNRVNENTVKSMKGVHKHFTNALRLTTKNLLDYLSEKGVGQPHFVDMASSDTGIHPLVNLDEQPLLPSTTENHQNHRLYSIVGFCNIHKIKHTENEKTLGRQAMAFARSINREDEIKDCIPHDNFGFVKGYPEDILIDFFKQKGYLY